MALVTVGGWAPVQIAGKALRWLWCKNKPVTLAVVAVVGVVKIRQHMKQRERRRRWNGAGKDVVVLHIFSRGYTCPSLSPFVIKLETYLRMADIPYQVDYEEPMGPKGKSPWITLNGEDMADSQLIMERLGPKFQKDLSSHLTAQEKAVAHSMRVMLDEYFLWCLAMWRYVKERGRPLVNSMHFPLSLRLMMPMFIKKVVQATYVQGIGRHSNQDVEEMGTKCLHSLSVWLGQKPFLMGDKPTEVDCSAFGMLVQILWCSPNSVYQKMLETDFRNLYDYCHRMKEKFYPDWDKCLDRPKQ
ncbi:failed axon connections homolog [Penaeus japonicus]|uniref:failed axon connections homolog n=1 Tax=Penaeus japonicus TaxID=27405 RepID=UPI001C70E908|nr:failed axon connections homolog [Penaeus japonicus]